MPHWQDCMDVDLKSLNHICVLGRYLANHWSYKALVFDKTLEIFCPRDNMIIWLLHILQPSSLSTTLPHFKSVHCGCTAPPKDTWYFNFVSLPGNENKPVLSSVPASKLPDLLPKHLRCLQYGAKKQNMLWAIKQMEYVSMTKIKITRDWQMLQTEFRSYKVCLSKQWAACQCSLPPQRSS